MTRASGRTPVDWDLFSPETKAAMGVLIVMFFVPLELLLPFEWYVSVGIATAISMALSTLAYLVVRRRQRRRPHAG